MKDNFNPDTVLVAGSVKGAMGALDDAGQKVGTSGRELWMVRPQDIEFIPGYNIPGRPAADRVAQIGQSILDNGYDQMEPIHGYVERRGARNVVLVTAGHTRTLGTRWAIERGSPVERVPVLVHPAGTSMIDLNVSLVRSNNGSDPVTPIGVAIVAKRLTAAGLDIPEIAKRLNFQPKYITDLLNLLSGPPKLVDLVNEGKMSVTLAIETLRTEGADAANAATAALDLAKSEGKEKATAKHMQVVTGKRESTKKLPNGAGKKARPPAAPAKPARKLKAAPLVLPANGLQFIRDNAKDSEDYEKLVGLMALGLGIEPSVIDAALPDLNLSPRVDASQVILDTIKVLDPYTDDELVDTTVNLRTLLTQLGVNEPTGSTANVVEDAHVKVESMEPNADFTHPNGMAGEDMVQPAAKPDEDDDY